MDRRNFIQTTGTVIAGATLAHGALGDTLQESSDSSVGGRLILPINRNWRYHHSYVEGAHEKTSTTLPLNESLFPIPTSNCPGIASTIRTTSLFPFTGGVSRFLPKHVDVACLLTLKVS